MTFSLSTVRASFGTRPTAQRRTSLFAALSVWQERRQLAGMDISRLKDLGISPQDAAREAARPFWDLPVHCTR